MKTVIETSFKNDSNKNVETFSVILDMDQLTEIASKTGLAGANKALDQFVAKFVSQFKEKFSAYINK